MHHPLSLIVKGKKRLTSTDLMVSNIFVHFHAWKLFVLCFIINLSHFHYGGMVQYCDWGRYFCVPTFPGYMNMSVHKRYIPLISPPPIYLMSDYTHMHCPQNS